MWIKMVAVCGLLLLPSGCASESLDSEAEAELLGWEQFLATTLSLPDGTIVVDGDIRVASEADLEPYFRQAQQEVHWARMARANSATDVASTRAPLLLMTAAGADSVWSSANKFALTYCVSANFGSRFNQIVSELDVAARSWSALAGVQFQYVPSASCDTNTNVVFDVVYSIWPGPNAISFFPHEGRPVRQLILTDAAFTTTAGGRDLQGILRHELGHALGFRHEHIVLNPPCTDGNGNWETADDPGTPVVEGYRSLTSYDVNSVMHYPQCRPSQTGGYRQTALDYAGAISIYGLAPALIQTIAVR